MQTKAKIKKWIACVQDRGNGKMSLRRPKLSNIKGSSSPRRRRSDIFWVFVCSLSYPACNAHAPYYIVICGLFGSTIFTALSHNWHDFRKKL